MEKGKATILEASADARLLYQRLAKLAPNELVSYAELSEIIGRNVIKVRHVLATARRMAQRENQIVTGAVSGEGIKRLDGHGIVSSATGRIKAIRGHARRGVRDLACATEPLEGDDLARHNMAMSMLGALELATRGRSVKKIEAAVSQAQQVIPMARALKELFE